VSESPSSRPTPSISVRAIVADPALGMEFAVLAGHSGLDRIIKHARIQKSGLALVGHFHGIVPSRVQILGQTELSFLQRLAVDERRARLRGFFRMNLSMVVLTQSTSNDDTSAMGVLPVPELMECAEESGTPLLASPERSSVTINAIHALLDDRLAPRVRLHGVLVDVFGVGLLLMGSSAIGKSESALDLVMRGHRLVADDVVECDFRPPGMVFGAAAELLRYHLEVRGLGILNVKDLFGVTAIRERKRIDVVVRLVEWSKDTEYDRLGLDDRHHTILGVKIRELIIPVRPGRDMASILEVAARNELLKNAGHHAAREFFGQLEGALLAEHPVTPPPSTSAPAIKKVNSEALPPPGHIAVRETPGHIGFREATPGHVLAPPLARSPMRAPESSATIPIPVIKPRPR
jgi:HPr kinase/phosphorylase